MALVGQQDVAGNIQRVAGATGGDVTQRATSDLGLVRGDGYADGVPRLHPAEVGQAVALNVPSHSFPDLRVGQAAQHRLQSAAVDPQGQQVAQWIRSGGVGILVAKNVHAPFPGRRDVAQQLIGASPAVHARQLQVSHLDSHPGGLADGDGLVHGFKDVVGFIPDVGSVGRAVAVQRAGKGHQLLGGRVISWCGE